MNRTFFEERLDPLGVTKENNKIQLYNPEAEPPVSKLYEGKVFVEDNQGNIVINYWTIEGEEINYYSDQKNPKLVRYQVKRLKEPKGDMKYKMPHGRGTYPWFSPVLVEKYRNKEKIETLFLTEGVFKAWKGCISGMDVVGLSSITHYRQKNGDLYEDILKLIKTCRVENVVILWDGDCLDISSKALLRKEDLSKRPFGFYSAATKIRGLLKKAFPDKNGFKIYFMHIKSGIYEAKPKGLDDLLITAKSKGQLKEAIKEAQILDKKGPFFYKLDITATNDRLYGYFGLKDAQVFHKMHSEEIGVKEFFFKRDLYYYHQVGDEFKLEMIAPSWARNLRWIGDEFFVDMVQPSARADQRVLTKFKKQTLIDLYGRHFQKYLKHFAGFCNVPAHFNFEQIVERDNKQFYNRYFPFVHLPEQGDCSLIIDFFKHIFGEHLCTHALTGEQIPSYELGLDYVQLLLSKPTQLLPIICLYSAENNTGKSTLGKLIQCIFQDNCVNIGNADLQSDFNEPYADKLLAICEETLLERKADAERIKALSTNNDLLVNPKGQKQYKIDFFCKFWFFSNNIRMVYLTRHDERYWVLQVKKPKKDIPNLLDQMKAQIPAFVHYLKHRKMATKRDGRMWFHASLIKTDTFKNIVEANEPSDATDLREALREWFLDMPKIDKLEMPLKYIKEEFFKGNPSSKWVREVLVDHLQVKQLRNEKRQLIYKRGKYNKCVFNFATNQFEIEIVEWKGRPYIFERDKILYGVEVVIEEEKEKEPVEEEVPANKADDFPF